MRTLVTRRGRDVLQRRPPGAPPSRSWAVTADALRHRGEALVRRDPARALLLALVAGWAAGRLVASLLARRGAGGQPG